jgi:hypothetical protein
MEIENEGPEPNRTVPIEVRWEIVRLKENGLSGVEVGKKLSRPASTCNAIYKKYLNTGTVEDIPRSGRPLKATEEVERKLLFQAESDSTLTVDQMIEESKTEISNRSARRILKTNGIRCKTARTKWMLTDQHRKDRLDWAKKHIRLPDEYWQRVVFTDESLIQRNNKKQRYWVPEGTEVPSIQKDRWQASILVWGAITYARTSMLEVVDGTMKATNYVDILTRRLLKNLPMLHPKHNQGDPQNQLIFQQDGAGPHGAKLVNMYFQDRGIEVLPWPAKSPDLNLIEAVWSELKGKLKRSYDSAEELEEDVKKQWKTISSDYIVSLYDSMRHRIQAVIDAKGGPTDY